MRYKRLEKLSLMAVEDRRTKGDVIMMHKIRGSDRVDWESLRYTRSQLKLKAQMSCKDVRKHFFQT